MAACRESNVRPDDGLSLSVWPFGSAATPWASLRKPLATGADSTAHISAGWNEAGEIQRLRSCSDSLPAWRQAFQSYLRQLRPSAATPRSRRHGIERSSGLVSVRTCWRAPLERSAVWRWSCLYYGDFGSMVAFDRSGRTCFTLLSSREPPNSLGCHIEHRCICSSRSARSRFKAPSQRAVQ